MAFEPKLGKKLSTDEVSTLVSSSSTTPQEAQTIKRPLLETIGAGLNVVFGGGKIGEAIGTGLAKSGLTGLSPQERQLVSPAPGGRELAGSALQSAALFTPIGRLAGGITAGARAAGLSRGVSAIGKIGAGAVAGGAFDVAQNIQEGGSAFKPGLGTAIGAAIPAVGVGVNVAGRVAQKVTPKLLSYTSDVPEKAFETMLARRQPVITAIKKGTTAEQALSETQGAVRQLRTTLSQEWDDATRGIYDEFVGKRWGMGSNAQKLASRVADDFGIELPANLKNMSAKESLDLLKEVNELYSKRAVRESAQGIGVRKLKDFLQKSTIKNFGGEKGSVAQLYKNYSTKKGVLDAANDIVKAYSTGKPIQQATALGRLKALFNENKSAYFDAILDLEKATGRDLISKITAVQFADKLPKKLSSVSASGGLQAPKGIIDKALDFLILPLSSPRSAGFIARAVQKIKSPGLPKGTSPGDRVLKTQAGQKLEAGVKEFAENPKLGLSIEDVSKKGSGVKSPSSTTLTQEARKYKTADEFVEAQPKVFRGSPVEEVSFGRQPKGNQIPYGAHFTPDRSIAESFATGVTKGRPTGRAGSITEATITAKNPFDVSATGNNGKHLFFEGSENYRILKEIAEKSGIDDAIEQYSKRIGGFPVKEQHHLYDDLENVIRPTYVLDNAKPEVVKSILKKEGLDPVIKYSMRATRDPLGMGAPVFTDALAVLDKSAIKTKSQLTDIWKKAQGGSPLLGNKDVVGALTHKDIGKIDIVYGKTGDKGYGLAKIKEKHPEMVGKIEGLLKIAKIRDELNGRIVLESPDKKYRIIIDRNLGDKKKIWLVNAYPIK